MKQTFSLNSNFSLQHNEDGSAKLEGFAIHGGDNFIVNGFFEVPASEMQNCAKTLQGAKLMKDHDHDHIDSIIGRVNATEQMFDEDAGMEGVKYEASLIVDDTNLAEKIEHGLIDATSIGFSYEPECSICHKPFFSEECTHHPFFDDMHFICRDMECHELSLVTFGADPHATVSGTFDAECLEKVKENFAKQKEEFIMSKQDDIVKDLQSENAELSQKVRDLEAQIEQKEKDFKSEMEDLKLSHSEEVLTLGREKEALESEITAMGEELSVFRAEAQARAEKELSAKKDRLVELANELKTEVDGIEDMEEEFIDSYIATFTKIIENTPKVPQFKSAEEPHEVKEEKREAFSGIGSFFGRQ